MTFRQQKVFDLTQDDSQSLLPGGEGEKEEDQTAVVVDGDVNDVNVYDVDSYLHTHVTNRTKSVDLTGESAVINTSTSSSSSTRTTISQTIPSRDVSPPTPYRRALKRRKHTTIQQQSNSNEQHQHEVQYLHTLQTPKKLSPPSNTSCITDDYAIAAALAQNDDCGSQIIQPNFKCTICLEEDLPGSQSHWIGGCRHQFCIGCLQSLIQSSMKSPCITARGGVPCPHVGCDGTLTITDIREVFYSDRTVWELYSEWTSLAMLEGEIGVEGNNDGVEGDGCGTGRAMTMRCPANRCNYTFVHESTQVTNNQQPPQPEGTLFVCPMCQQAYCLNCKANGGKIGPAHDLTCLQRLEQLERTKEERQKLEEWKKENAMGDVRFQELMRAESQKGATKPCPKCKRLITKNGGCDHMHCASCNHSYNWSQAGGYVE